MSAVAESRSSAIHRLGVFLVAASAVAWSVSGIFARLLTVDVWTAVAIRAEIGAVYMAIGLIYVHRGQSLAAIRSIGWLGLFVGLCGAASMLCFIGAFFNTSIANVSVIYATTPFIAAGLGWLIMREAVGPYPDRRDRGAGRRRHHGRRLDRHQPSSRRYPRLRHGTFLCHRRGHCPLAPEARNAAGQSLLLPRRLGVALPFASLASATPLDLAVLSAFAFT